MGKIVSKLICLRPCYDLELANANFGNLPTFVPVIKSGKVVKVYDGDTITIAARFPKYTGKLYRFSVRLNGIDTPEIKGKSENEKKLAKEARDALSTKILNNTVILKEVKLEKYGRLLATIYYKGINLNQWLIDNNHAVPYDGGTKSKDWSRC